MCRLILVLTISALISSSYAQYPRLANYYLNGDITTEFADSLAQYDLIVLDMELQGRDLQLFSDIRTLNPDIKILAYMTCQEINPDVDEWEPLRLGLRESIEEEWWLWESDGSHAIFWPGTWMLNVSDLCPEVNGLRWYDRFADFVHEELMSNDVWDGFYIDNCWYTVSWLSDELDLNHDGVAEDSREVDRAWKAGMDSLLTRLRNNDPNKIFMGNTGYVYQDFLNGVLIENFPEWNGWTDLMKVCRSFENEAIQPAYNIINASPEAGNLDDYQKMRFGLTSALLVDAYYCYDFGAEDHSQFWWYDEFNIDLGAANGEAVCLDSSLVLSEDFENGAGGFVLNNWDEMITQLVEDSLQGDYAIQCNTLESSDEWHEFLITPEDLQLLPGSEIRVKFLCRADSLNNNTVFYCLARSESGGYDQDRVFLFTDMANTNNIGFVDTTLNLANFNDYRLIWGIQHNGLLSIDDIVISDDSNLLYSREFENGLVICNPSNNNQTINLPGEYQKIDGIQDPEFNNGELVNFIDLQAGDGIILLNATSVNSRNNQTQLEFFKLSDAYPNPFNNSTKIEYTISHSTHIEAELFDILGRKLRTLSRGRVQAGVNKITINADDLSSGTYFISLKSKHHSSMKKIVLLK